MDTELSSAKYFQEQEDGPKEHAIKIKDADWTKGLTVTCFLSILFGLWGLGTAAHGFQRVIRPLDATKQMARRASYEELKMIHAANKVEKNFRPYRILFYGTKFVLSVALISGAAILMMKLPFARNMMFLTCGGAVIFHVAGAALSCAMLVAVSGQIEESSRMSLAKYASNMQSVDGIVNQFMNQVAFGTLMGTFFSLFFKCGVYVRMMLFMNTPFVRAVYGEDPYPEYDEMLATR